MSAVSAFDRSRRLCAMLLGGLLLAGVGGLTPARAAMEHYLTQSVDPKTGVITFVVRAFQGATGVAYELTYRARSGYAGMFGSDWGSTLETRIVPMRDNTVVVVNDGNGSLNTYGRATEAEFQFGLEVLTNAELGYGAGSATERAAVKAELAKSREYRLAITEIYGMQPAVADEAEFKLEYYIDHPDQCCQLLRRYTWFWVMEWNAGKAYFDDTHRGRLTTYEDSLHSSTFNYYSDGPLYTVCYVDASRNCTSRYLYFFYNEGAVIAQNQAGERVTYTKDGKGRLISIETSAALIYRFRYDARGNIVAMQLEESGQPAKVMILTYDSANRVLTRGWEGSDVVDRYSY